MTTKIEKKTPSQIALEEGLARLAEAEAKVAEVIAANAPVVNAAAAALAEADAKYTAARQDENRAIEAALEAARVYDTAANRKAGGPAYHPAHPDLVRAIEEATGLKWADRKLAQPGNRKHGIDADPLRGAVMAVVNRETEAVKKRSDIVALHRVGDALYERKSEAYAVLSRAQDAQKREQGRVWSIQREVTDLRDRANKAEDARANRAWAKKAKASADPEDIAIEAAEEKGKRARMIATEIIEGTKKLEW
jgi:hypothetical protein